MTRPITSHIREADPEFNERKGYQVEYVFSNGRKFSGRTDTRGPYANDIE